MSMIAATGTTQGTAAVMDSALWQEVVFSDAGVDDGVLLSRNTDDFFQTKAVRNSAVDPVQVYPPSGEQIDDLGVDAPYEMDADKSMMFVYFPSSGQWYTLIKILTIKAEDLPPGSSGTVTSVALSLPAEFSISGSPVTTSGTLSATWADETANYIFAGPTSGGAATPAFRALVAADIPNLPASIITSGTMAIARGGTNASTTSANFAFIGPTSGGAAAPSFRALVTADMPAGTGTVTSVALSLPAEFTVSNSPVTTTGTLTAVWANETANYVFAGPTTGSPDVPAFRALVAADIPNLAASKITSGTLAIAQGGTNAATTSANFAFIGPTSGGAAAPSFRALVTADMPAGTGTVTSVALSITPTWLTAGGTPITTSGTLTITAATQTANTFLAGPTSGSATAPTFRALAAADLQGVANTMLRNFTLTSSVTVANTVTETTVIGAGSGSNTTTLRANLFAAGSGIDIEAWGYLSTAAAIPTIRLRFKLGSTVILDTTAKSLVVLGALSNALWKFKGKITCRTAGASGTVFAQGEFSYKETVVGAWRTFQAVSTSTVTIDTTGTLVADLMVTWGTASASNTFTCSNCSIMENQ